MNKIVKRMLTLTLAMGIILTMVLPLAAAEPKVVQPRMTGISTLTTRLNISASGKATCGVTLYNKGDYDVTVVIDLKQDGTTIKSWTVTPSVGNNQITKYQYVSSGHDYQVVATALVKSGGVLVHSYEVTSGVVSY